MRLKLQNLEKYDFKINKNGEDIFLQTTTNAVIDSSNKTLTTIIQDLENNISALEAENEKLKETIEALEKTLTDKITELGTNLTTKIEEVNTNLTNEIGKINTSITQINGKITTLENNGTDYLERIVALENQAQKLGSDGDFKDNIKAPGFFQK